MIRVFASKWGSRYGIKGPDGVHDDPTHTLRQAAGLVFLLGKFVECCFWQGCTSSFSPAQWPLSCSAAPSRGQRYIVPWWQRTPGSGLSLRGCVTLVYHTPLGSSLLTPAVTFSASRCAGPEPSECLPWSALRIAALVPPPVVWGRDRRFYVFSDSSGCKHGYVL